MNKFLIPFILIGLLLLAGCVIPQEVPPARRVADDQEKITRFDYMDNRWSYMEDRWITGKKTTPYVMMNLFHIPREQATKEIKEFETIQVNIYWIQRFFTWVNLCGTRYYINPPN